MDKLILVRYTPIELVDRAIGKCHDRGCSKDRESMEKRIDRVCNKLRHESILEHISYTFEVVGVSRALLQELARHRMASLSVKSTRYTLKELKDCPEAELSKFLVSVNDTVDSYNYDQLILVQDLLRKGMSNDEVKYCLPEAFKTSFIWTINARALKNFLSLRLAKEALWEIREFAKKILEAIPDSHKVLYQEFIDE